MSVIRRGPYSFRRNDSIIGEKKKEKYRSSIEKKGVHGTPGFSGQKKGRESNSFFRSRKAYVKGGNRAYRQEKGRGSPEKKKKRAHGRSIMV